MGKIGLVCLWFLFAVMIVILVITFIWGNGASRRYDCLT